MATEMALQDTRLTAASAVEITHLLHQLFANLPLKGGEDKALVLNGYIMALEGYPEWAIAAAVRKLIRGVVPDASDRFCPKAPELARIVRDEMGPVYDEIEKRKRKFEWKERASARPGNSPFERQRAKLIAENAHLPVLFEGISHARFLELHKAKQIPVGGKWVAFLGTVYGPPAVAQREAAE